MTGCSSRTASPDGRYQGFDATELTQSNWGPDLRHGSPPLALLTRAVQELLADSPLRIARLGRDILGAVPAARVWVHARVRQPGRRVCLLTAELRACDRAAAARPVAAQLSA